MGIAGVPHALRNVSVLGRGGEISTRWVTGQRARPTVRKKTESNGVLTCIDPSLPHHYLLYWDFFRSGKPIDRAAASVEMGIALDCHHFSSYPSGFAFPHGL